MGATLATAVPGWTFGATKDFAARVARGHAREVGRMRGQRFALVLALSEFNADGLSESIELLNSVPDLEEGAVRAEAECRVRA